MPADWPAEATRPRRRDGSSAVELDENLALYDDVGQLLILLNTSAASVWELCDGETTLHDMVRILSEAHGEDATVIAGDVYGTVRKLADLGLVVDVAPDGEEDDQEDDHGEDEEEAAGG